MAEGRRRGENILKELLLFWLLLFWLLLFWLLLLLSLLLYLQVEINKGK